MSLLKDLLLKHEGLALIQYEDTEGNKTIGVGHKLKVNETLTVITETEAFLLLESDIKDVMKQAKIFPWIPELNEARRAVVYSMIFNLGVGKFREFKKLIKALEVRDYEQAASEMLKSKWASQVKDRAKQLASLMRLGA